MDGQLRHRRWQGHLPGPRPWRASDRHSQTDTRIPEVNPAELLTELTAIDKAGKEERRRTELGCRCHWTKGGEAQPHNDFLQREQYHPTDTEDNSHMELVVNLRRRERDCLKAILGIGQEPVGQLALFGSQALT